MTNSTRRNPIITRDDISIFIAVLVIMLVEVIAVFNNGGYFLPAMTLCVIVAWLVLIGLIFFSGNHNHLSFSKISVAVIALISLLWIWTGASIFWSISSDLSWLEFNRTGGFLALMVIGTIVGQNRKARWLTAFIFMIIAATAAVYMISVKALPSVISNLEELARVSVPLGYANAAGLMSAFAIPMAVYFSAERKMPALVRLSSCISTMLLLTALLFTISRGAILALIFGLSIYFIFSPIRIRSWIMLTVASIPTFLIVLWSTGQTTFMNDKVELQTRIETAETLRWYLALGIMFVIVSTLIILYVDKKITFSLIVVRITGIFHIVLACALIIVFTTLFMTSREPSFMEWADNTYTEFTSIGGNKGDVYRLFEVGRSGNRWQLWQESIISWQKKPIYGSGAQSFPLTHLITREPDVNYVKQPHGLLFRLLSELGLVGLLIFSAFISLTIAVATLIIKKLQDRMVKGLAVAMLATTSIYLVHTSYDWDWNMFALTMPYFLFTGILVGWYGSLRTQALPAATHQPACPELSAGARYPRADRR